MQATVTPAPDAEHSSGSAQNTGVSGTRHEVAAGQDTSGRGTPGHGVPSQGGYGQGSGGRRRGRRLGPIRYAHTQRDEQREPGPAAADTASGTVPPAPVQPAAVQPTAVQPTAVQPATVQRTVVQPDTVRPDTVQPDTVQPDTVRPDTVRPATATVRPDPVQPGTPGTAPDDDALSGTVLSGTVVPGTGPAPAAADRQKPASPGRGAWASPAPGAWQPSSGQGPEPAGAEPAGPGEVRAPGARVPNEGLGIFGGVATTEVTDEPGPAPAKPAPARPAPAQGAEWNQPIASAPQPSEAPPEEDAGESKAGPFGRLAGMLRGGAPAGDDQPRTSIRDLPPDVQLRLWRVRLTIMVIVGAVFAALTRSWEVALTLAILAGILDTVYRSRNAASYQVAGPHMDTLARRRTIKQLTAMRREGYLALDARPIPNSREYIDHLVIGPTGVYAIDSEKWDPKLPVRTLNGRELFLGPESHKDRLKHALWEARQASEILSGALGTEVSVRPALAIYGPKIPWDIVTIRNVDVFTGAGLRRYLKRRARLKDGRDGVVRLSAQQVQAIYDAAARVLPDVTPAAPPQTYSPVG